jgi:pyruvyltransferase
MIPPFPVVKAYWWKGAGTGGVDNWGDRLTPLLLRRFAHVEAEWTERGSTDVVCVGSLLGNIIAPYFKGTILGTGKLHEDGIVPPKATILGLRGPLTALGVPGSYALGDPGLLADELVRIDTKRFDLCLIPHWSDKTLALDPRFTRYPHVVVNPFSDPLDAIALIAQSHKVVSSSLHGLILADALALPRWFEDSAPDWKTHGGTFKVRDHDQAVGLPFIVGKTQLADANRVIALKTGLKQAFRAYGKKVAV